MNPPRTAKTPFPVTLPPRSYPRSVRRRTKRIGDNTRSVSIKNAFSLHHVCVFTAFFMERAFSENHNSPRSRFWGVREAIRSSFVSGGAGVFILYGCILSQMREKFKKCHGERIRHPGGVFGKKFKIHELYVFIARSGFSETAISTALIVRLMIFAIARFSSGDLRVPFLFKSKIGKIPRPPDCLGDFPSAVMARVFVFLARVSEARDDCHLH